MMAGAVCRKSSPSSTERVCWSRQCRTMTLLFALVLAVASLGAILATTVFGQSLSSTDLCAWKQWSKQAKAENRAPAGAGVTISQMCRVAPAGLLGVLVPTAQIHRASFSGGGRSLFILSMMVVVGAASASPWVQLWAFDTGGSVRSSPALSPDGATLYIGSWDSKVYALRTSTGEQQWAFETGGYVFSSPALSPDGATLYIGSHDRKVYALRTSTGEQQWTFDTGGDVRSSPALSPDGATLYIGSYDYKVYALRTSTGEQQWEFDTGDDVQSSPALSPDGATLYIGSGDKKVYALEMSTGEKQWAFDTGDLVLSSPVLSPDGATLYIGSGDKKVYALRTSTGEQQWTFDTGDRVYSSPVLSPDGATLYIGSNDNKVYALRTSTGEQQWAFVTGDWVFSSPALSPDGATLFIGSDDNKVYALRNSTGEQQWAFDTGDDVYSSPALSPDGLTLYIGSDDGKVYALFTGDCPAGTGVSEFECTICAAGTFSATRGASECTDCGPGTYSWYAAATSCSGSTCAAGQYAPARSTSAADATCTSCPAGLVSSAGATECILPEKELDDKSPGKLFLAYGVLPLVLFVTLVIVSPRCADKLGLDDSSRCSSVFKIACGMLDFASDLVFVSLLDPREPIRFGIAVAACALSTGLSLCVALHYNENFFFLLTTSLDTKKDHNKQAAVVNRWIVLFVEDVTFLGLEISFLVLGKKLNGLDWVIWGQALAFTLTNMIRNVWSIYIARQRTPSGEVQTESVSAVQLAAQAAGTVAFSV